MSNVPDPAAFAGTLSGLMERLYELFELTREQALAPVSDAGVMVYTEQTGKTCFQVAGQYERPSEFLQALLDMLRVTYEPWPLGTFLLNANPGFITEAIPDQPFRLGYASLVSDPGESFSGFWQDKVRPALTGHGYPIERARAVFAVVSTGPARYGFELAGEAGPALGAGFSAGEALTLIASAAGGQGAAPVKPVHAGYCLAEELEDRLRVSVWLFLEQENRN